MQDDDRSDANIIDRDEQHIRKQDPAEYDACHMIQIIKGVWEVNTRSNLTFLVQQETKPTYFG